MEARQVLCAGPGRLCQLSAWRLSLGVESKVHVDSGFRWLTFPISCPSATDGGAAWLQPQPPGSFLPGVPHAVSLLLSLSTAAPWGPVSWAPRKIQGVRTASSLSRWRQGCRDAPRGPLFPTQDPEEHEPVRLLLAPLLAPRPSTFVPAASLETCASALPSQSEWVGGPKDSYLGILFRFSLIIDPVCSQALPESFPWPCPSGSLFSPCGASSPWAHHTALGFLIDLYCSCLLMLAFCLGNCPWPRVGFLPDAWPSEGFRVQVPVDRTCL